MSDTSKTPISRIDKLDDTIEDINTSIDTNTSELNSKIEDLLNELNDLKSKRHIIETWNDGDNWYIIYSDGWLEQGGIITASTQTLHKPYKDTSYHIWLGFISGTDGCWFTSGKTTTNFKQYIKYYGIGNTLSTTANYWRAMGWSA